MENDTSELQFLELCHPLGCVTRLLYKNVTVSQIASYSLHSKPFFGRGTRTLNRPLQLKILTNQSLFNYDKQQPIPVVLEDAE